MSDNSFLALSTYSLLSANPCLIIASLTRLAKCWNAVFPGTVIFGNLASVSIQVSSNSFQTISCVLSIDSLTSSSLPL